MITCKFEDGQEACLRHVTVGAILLNQKRDRVLMVRRAENLLEAGKLGFPGGYLDRNESVTEGLLRETMEETGHEGIIISIFRINDSITISNDGGRQCVDIIFLVECGKKVADFDHETAELVWVDLNNLPTADKVAFDHLDSLILFNKYRAKKTPLPIVGKISL